MSNLARWETYSPFSVGLSDMFNRLDAMADSQSANYPPYNIFKVSDTEQEIQIALAGFKKEDIEVAVEKQVLTVRANHESKGLNEGYIHKGVAFRNVARNWQLSDNAVVSQVKYEDGLLRITVGLEIPEEQKRKLLPIT